MRRARIGLVVVVVALASAVLGCEIEVPLVESTLDARSAGDDGGLFGDGAGSDGGVGSGSDGGIGSGSDGGGGSNADGGNGSAASADATL